MQVIHHLALVQGVAHFSGEGGLKAGQLGGAHGGGRGAMSPPVRAPVRERCLWPAEPHREEARRVASPPMVLKRDPALEMRVVV